MSLAAIDCPKCGAALGAADANGERVCGYCGQRTGTSGPAFANPQSAVRAQAPLRAQASERARGASEVLQRSVRKIDDAQRLSGYVNVGLGVLFGGFAVACFAGALFTSTNDGLGGAVGGITVFGLFWTGLATLLGGLGIRSIKRVSLKRRLLATGIHGTARVVSYKESNMRVNGATLFTLSLEIVVPNRPAWNAQRSEAVSRSSMIYTNASLPVLVDPTDPNAFVINWWHEGE